MSRPRALVTGANGFLGSHLSRSLSEAGVEVHALVHDHRDSISSLIPASHIHEVPQRCEEAIRLLNEIRPHTIYHLAATYRQETDGDFDGLLMANITVGSVLLEAASRLYPKPAFLMACSFFQFAGDGAYNPNTLYAASKQAQQDILHYYWQRKGVPAMALVLYDVYGPGDRRPKVWNALFDPQTGPMLQLSPGDQLIELVHVDDVVEAFQHAAELLHARPPAELVYGVRARERKPLRALLEEIKLIAGADISLCWGATGYRDSEILVPCSVQPLPGWKPRISLGEGFGALSQSSVAG